MERESRYMERKGSGFYIHLGIIGALFVFYINLNTSDTIPELSAPFVLLLIGLRKIFISREHRIEKAMRKYISILIVLSYSSILVIFFGFIKDLPLLLQWAVNIGFLIFSTLIYMYLSLLFPEKRNNDI